MRILVVGASNSLLRGGYLARAEQVLRGNLGDSVDITNISVGGTTSITGASRVLELPASAAFDMVVYEYAMNDANHFTPRQNGAAFQFLAIQLLVGALAERFPDAVLAPLIFSMQHLFSTATPNRIHDLQSEVWNTTGTPHLDVRQRLSHLFAQQAPDWLYSDPAHYATPQATDIIGSMVGRFLIEQARAKAPQPVSETYRKLRALPRAAPFRLKHLDAQALAAHAHGEWEMVVRTNSVMSTPALRLRPGGGLKLAEAPFNISVLSDRLHDWGRVTRGGTGPVAVSTRYIAVDNPAVNPDDKDRFFYSGVPFPLLRPNLSPARDPAPFELALEAADQPLPEMLAFDSFLSRDLRPAAGRRLDLAGMTFLEDA